MVTFMWLRRSLWKQCRKFMTCSSSITDAVKAAGVGETRTWSVRMEAEVKEDRRRS
jgi:hypothetical protein